MHEHEFLEEPIFIIFIGLRIYCFACLKSVVVIGKRLGAVSVDVPWKLITKDDVREGTLMVIFPVLVSSLGNAVEVGSVILFKIFVNFGTSWSPHLDGLLRWHMMSVPVIREPIVQDSINLLSIPSVSHSCCQWLEWSSTEVANYWHEFLVDFFEAGGVHG